MFKPTSPKKTGCLLLALLFAFILPVNAQGLKGLINRVKQASSKNTNTTGQTTTSGTGTQGQASAGDSAAAARAVQKGLGNLMGGGGVSAADSAAALAVYNSSNGGAGIYYEYTTEMTTKRSGTVKSVTKIYFTDAGEGRSEMNIGAMMGAKNAHPIAMIGRSKQPTYSVTLSDDTRQYSLNVIDTALISSGGTKDQVTKIGEETINGYHCIHAKLVATVGSGMFKSSSTMQVWTSTAVPGYATMRKMMLQNVTPSMMKALDDAGCGGFIVQMTSGEGKSYSMTMSLTKAEKQTFPSSLFRIPSGYTKSDDNMMVGNMMQAGASEH